MFADDHSRVKLIQLDDDITTDYINANYIQVSIRTQIFSFTSCYGFCYLSPMLGRCKNRNDVIVLDKINVTNAKFCMTVALTELHPFVLVSVTLAS